MEEVIAWKWSRRASEKCPIPDCDYRYHSINGLMGHLTVGHLKSELAKKIVDDVALWLKATKLILAGDGK